MDFYDIAIIGAGPAGATFAREISNLCPDFKMLLIDGQSEDFKKPCGGLLSPSAQKFFAEQNISLPKDVLADPQIFAVDTIDLVSKKERCYRRCYLNMDRYLFDRWLLSLIPSGVTVISDRVKKIEKQNSAYTLTLSMKKISAHFLVGADGGNSAARRFLGKKYTKQYISIQEWYKNDDPKVPYYSCIFDRKTSDSCSWTIHKDGFIIFGGAFENKGCREAFALQKNRLEAFLGTSLGEAIKREACLVTSPRRAKDLFCGSENVFLIGEAAGFITSDSFEGISSAMISAKGLAAAFHSSGSDGKRVLRIYKKNIKKLKRKLKYRMIKRKILCSPTLRYIIMKSGICSVNKTDRKAAKKEIEQIKR